MDSEVVAVLILRFVDIVGNLTLESGLDPNVNPRADGLLIELIKSKPSLQTRGQMVYRPGVVSRDTLS